MSEPTQDPVSIAAAADAELLAALADDYGARLRRREHPAVEEYVAKHPELADRIRKVLSAVALIEQGRPDATFSAEGPGSTVGRYKLLERIGEGGFGIVYMAEQQYPIRRKVALKVIKPGMDSRQVLARFEAERQALAIMDHPNIARVLDAGATDSGRPFFVMELVKGEPITEYCDHQQLEPRQRMELFVQVCQAVQHAHQKGIIHRDIKPSNVFVSMHDTKAVVKVIDFGVAKALGQELTEKTLFTGFAQLVGTPLYMSPEQAGESALDVDTRSDIYSLGVLLYELLTGTTPFDKERFRKAAHDEIRRIIREEEPPRPSTRLSQSKDLLASISAQRHTEPAKLTRLVRGELDWIVMKALEKDRTRRYDTANGFAADVERHLQDEPVLACPPSAAYKLKKFAHRHRVSLSTAAVIALVLVLATAISSWQAVRATRATRQLGHERDKAVVAEHQADRERNQALVEKQRADAQERATRIHLYATQMNLAQQAWEAADVLRVRELLDLNWPAHGEDDLRGFEWYYLWRLSHDEGRALCEQTANVKAMCVSPDGRTVAVGSGSQVTFWGVEDGRALGALPNFATEVRALTFSPDGSRLAVGGGAASGGYAAVWEVENRRVTWSLPTVPGAVLSLAFSPDGRSLAAGMATLTSGASNPATRVLFVAPQPKRQMELQLWNAADGAELKPFEGQANGMLSVAFSPDGRTLAAGSWDRTATLWDVESRRRLHEPLRFASRVWDVSFSPDGKLLATASGDFDGLSELKLWDAQTLELQGALLGHRTGISSVTFSSDGAKLLSGGFDREVRLWDVATRAERGVYRGHTRYVSAVAFASGDKRIVSAGWDRSVRLWDASQLQDVSILPRALNAANSYSLAFMPDGMHLAVAGYGARIIDVARQSVSAELPHPGYDTLMAFSRDGKQMATVGSDGAARLWNPDTKELYHVLRGHADKQIWAICLSPDGGKLATGAEDHRLIVWDTRSGKETAAIDLAGIVRACAMTSDGRQLAVSVHGFADDGTLGSTRLLELKTLRQTGTLPTAAHSLAFSPDGTILAKSNGKSIELWDTQTWRKARVLRGHIEQVWHLAFSPDGRTLATGSWDGTVKLWNVASGALMLTFPAKSGVVWGVAFSPDGRTLAASSGQGKDKVHNVSFWHASEGQVTRDSSSPSAALQSLLDRVNVLDAEGKPGDLEQAMRALLAEQRDRLGENSVEATITLRRLIALLFGQKKLVEAQSLLREVLARPSADIYGEGGVVEQMNAYAWRLRQAGQLQEAATVRQQIVEGVRSTLKHGDPRRIRFQLDYAELLIQMKQWEQAERLLLDSRGEIEENAPFALRAASRLVQLYDAWGRPEKAMQYRAKLPAQRPATQPATMQSP